MEGQGESEWIVVRHKKRKHIGKEVKPEKVFMKGGNARFDREVNISLQEEFFSHPNRLLNTQIITTSLKGLECCQIQVQCLGLGSFSSFLKPQIQLLFLKHIVMGQLKDMEKQFVLNIFDPVFTAGEKQEVRQMGGSCIQFVKMQKGRAYIMYMPHCDRFLYERLCQLKIDQPECQVIVIGNSIKQYKDICAITGQAVPESLQVFSPHQIKIHDYKQAFNDTFIYTL